MRLNPLGIGEGFELSNAHVKAKKKCLNPLGIGEGFELVLCSTLDMNNLVLIP